METVYAYCNIEAECSIKGNFITEIVKKKFDPKQSHCVGSNDNAVSIGKLSNPQILFSWSDLLLLQIAT
jgi:hypothetical protein